MKKSSKTKHKSRFKPVSDKEIAHARKALGNGSAVVVVDSLPAKKGPPPPPTKAQVTQAVSAATGQPTHLRYTSEPDKNGQTCTVVTPVGHGDFSSAKGTVVGTRPLNTFREGAVVDIDGCPNMQRLTVERIGVGGVTVSGGKLEPHTVLSGASPAVPHTGANIPVATSQPGAVVAPARAEASASRKAEGVCAFIENLIMNPPKGGYTKQEIVAKVIEAFPGRDPASTLNTVGIRPTFLRKRGLTPPPFRKA